MLEPQMQVPSPAMGAMDELLARREKALALVASAMAQLVEATNLMPIRGTEFTSALRQQSWFSLDTRPDGFQQEVMQATQRAYDGNGWRWLLDSSGLGDLMTADDKKAIERQLHSDPMPLSREAVQGTFVALFEKRHEVFRRGVVELFRGLCKQYRSHSAFKIQRRLVLNGAFSQYGGWASFSSARERVDDLERILLVLEGQEPSQVPHDERLSYRLEESRKAALLAEGERTGELETDWLRCRWFANGNLHLWLKREDHIDRINALIADYCGAALAHDHHRKTGA